MSPRAEQRLCPSATPSPASAALASAWCFVVTWCSTSVVAAWCSADSVLYFLVPDALLLSVVVCSPLPCAFANAYNMTETFAALLAEETRHRSLVATSASLTHIVLAAPVSMVQCLLQLPQPQFPLVRSSTPTALGLDSTDRCSRLCPELLAAYRAKCATGGARCTSGPPFLLLLVLS